MAEDKTTEPDEQGESAEPTGQEVPAPPEASQGAVEQADTPVEETGDGLPENTVTIADTGKLRKRFTVEVARERIEAKFNEMFGELGHSAQVPGFRVGHAPRRLIEKRFGTEFLTGREELRRKIGEVRTGSELWRPLLLVAIALACLEIFVAARWHTVPSLARAVRESVGRSPAVAKGARL